MFNKTRFIVLAAVLSLAALLSAHRPAVRTQEEVDEESAAWIKSKDPCYTVKQEKKYMKDNFGQDSPYLKCVPLEIHLTWEFESSMTWHGKLGTDVLKGKLEETFPGFIQLTYDQQKQTELSMFRVQAPGPCCPGAITAWLDRIHGGFMTTDHAPREHFRPFVTEGSENFILTPSDQTVLDFEWTRGSPSQGMLESSKIQLKDEAISSPWSAFGGAPTSLKLNLQPLGSEALSQSEIEDGLERGVLQKEFTLSHTQKLAPGLMTVPSESLTAKCTMAIEFGEAEKETWRVTVEGWEKDDQKPAVPYQAKGVTRELPIQVDFEWRLQGEFVLRKNKAGRTYDSGKLLAASVTPRVVFNSPELFNCDIVPYLGESPEQQTAAWAGLPIIGKVSGGTVKLTWPQVWSQVAVRCQPRKPGNVSYNKIFGNKGDFLSNVGAEILPLKDGMSVSGSRGQWMTYKVTLKKVK
jgi:hypothetical protein